MEGGGVKNWSKLPTYSTKKLPTWGRGVSKIWKTMLTSFMDGPLMNETIVHQINIIERAVPPNVLIQIGTEIFLN